jgi:hypothetical protein
MVLSSNKFLFRFIFFLILLSCTKKSELGQNNTQFQKWKNQKIADYEFTLTVNCFCTIETRGPHAIVVKGNKIQSVNGETYDPIKHYAVKTIDELFEVISINLERKPFSKTLEYDSRYHFPSNIYFDISQMIADEEIGYTVSQFKPR